MSYERILEPIDLIRESCEILLSGAAGRTGGDQRESMKSIYASTGGLYTLFVDVITTLGLENTAQRASLTRKFHAMLQDIIDHTRSLLDELDGPLTDEQREILGFIRETGETLLQHIEAISLYSRLHLNVIDVNHTPVSIPHVLRTLEIPPVDRSVQPSVFADEGLPFVVTDETLVRRCIQELVNNAARFSVSDLIIVHCQNIEESLRIDVIDSGQGIDSRRVNRLFEPFYQGDEAVGGIGLGLTIAGQIARLLHGKVELAGTQAGVGSTFSLVLPAA